jgi:hypothetical protein
MNCDNCKRVKNLEKQLAENQDYIKKEMCMSGLKQVVVSVVILLTIALVLIMIYK